MRLTSVIMHSTVDMDDIEFSIREANIPSRYIVRQIVGIDADELIPKFYGRGIQTDSKFYDFVMKPKDIVMRVAMNPSYNINESVSEIRDEIYKRISANRTGQIQLQFMSGASLVCVINGMITRMEVGYFSKLPELQITVHCPDPTFRSIHPIDYVPGNLPETNPIIMPDSASTAPHGLSFKVKFTAAVTDFIIQDDPTDPEWMFKVSPDGGFAIDDELWFSSEFANKLVYLHNISTPHHLMDRIDDDSVWPTIFPGDNTFYFLPIEDIFWLEFKYYSAYWGV